MNKDDRCGRCGQRLSWIALDINLGLFVIDAIFALVSDSRALFAASLQSLANAVASVIVLVGLKVAEKERDEKHPYGYGKMEFLVSETIYLVLLIGAILFLFETTWELFAIGPEKPPKLIAVVPAFLSILCNEFLFRYGRCAGDKLRSPALLTNAWANRADVVTSCAVIAAVVMAHLSWHHVDHLVGLFIGIWIAKIALSGLETATRGLMDYSSEAETDRIRDLVGSVEGIEKIKDIKARWVGRKIWVDLEIGIPGHLILREGLEMVQRLKRTLFENMKQIGDVTVRLSPANSG
ncbi:MAG: cation diffusion facilitator family transporter [Elusimicrobia bacterium]|nr:cation diffusion facilitator family transporter [Candidatus Obscuribacterium magneticum]